MNNRNLSPMAIFRPLSLFLSGLVISIGCHIPFYTEVASKLYSLFADGKVLARSLKELLGGSNVPFLKKIPFAEIVSRPYSFSAGVGKIFKIA